MNNFVFSQDPLLFQTSYQPKNNDDYELKQKQLNDMMQQQYRQLQQLQQLQQNVQSTPQQKDHIGELDEIIRGLRKEVSETLLTNEEYLSLHNELQTIIQEELMSSIRWKVNSNSKAIENIEKQKKLINDAKNQSEEEERKNISEINDYMKNYPTMTFDEYKKLKNKKK